MGSLNILKPKSQDDIRKNFSDIIFWYRFINTTNTPLDWIKYRLDDDHVAEQAARVGMPVKDSYMLWEKQLIYMMCKLETMNGPLSKKINSTIKGSFLRGGNHFIDWHSVYDRIWEIIHREYHSANKLYYSHTGKNL